VELRYRIENNGFSSGSEVLIENLWQKMGRQAFLTCLMRVSDPGKILN
jgi:hypothetical protein